MSEVAIVESCLCNVESRFDLVLKAAKRAHALELGAESFLPTDSIPTHSNPAVLALREIAAGHDVTQTPVAQADAEEYTEFNLDDQADQQQKSLMTTDTKEQSTPPLIGDTTTTDPTPRD